ncbi:hypothetical protein SEA_PHRAPPUCCINO_109 [Mycobacterium phage Phrappuccino]|uniref:Uncharacterized protein n=1 Tax=Mycobacterium phage Phrappuccino TaxID=2591223 RepID=A0A514DDU4_9CAUD|nr:hypothetical protein KHQ87_gp109 [Mycobacterium phage Phrappuccino]QDH91784.1 hypothetical protein SEA_PHRAPPUCCINO_109 [Mycobacterium phage Phrappuccino]QIQ63226.1 hypothetical protein SEA_SETTECANDELA_109 [Mycobacterium phage Settecandela]
MKHTGVITHRPHWYPRVFIAYGPGPVPREEAHWRNWRKWNGLGFRIGNTIHFCEIR